MTCVHCKDLKKPYVISTPDVLVDIMMMLQGYLKSKVLQEIDAKTLCNITSELFDYKKGDGSYNFYGADGFTHKLRCNFCGLIYVLYADYYHGRCSFKEETEEALKFAQEYAAGLERLKIWEKEQEAKKKAEREKWLAVYKKSIGKIQSDDGEEGEL